MTPRRTVERPVKPPRFSRRWWWGQLHDLFWVLLATLLIWIYADMEFTDTQKVTMTLRLTTGDPTSSMMELLSQKEYTVTMEISGNRSILERYRQRLAAQGSTLTVNVAQDYESGDRAVPTRELLQKAANLRGQGIAIKSVAPQAVAVHLDRLVRVTDVPVRLDYTGAVLEQPDPTATVDLRVLETQTDRLNELLHARPGQPVLSTQRIDLKALEPGKAETLQAEVLRAVDGIEVRPEPSTVTFEVRVKRTTSVRHIQVSVKILTPPEWAETGLSAAPAMWTEFALDRQNLDDWRIELSVSGPTENLKEENIVAYVELTNNDRPKPGDDSWLPGKQVKVRFREGTGLSLTRQPPELKLRLKRRQVGPAR
jgi:hypothetical protein